MKNQHQQQEVAIYPTSFSGRLVSKSLKGGPINLERFILYKHMILRQLETKFIQFKAEKDYV